MRLPDAVYMESVHRPMDITAADSEILLYADWQYRHNPVLVCRPLGKGKVAATTLQAYDNPFLQQVLYRLIRYLTGRTESNRPLGVGILGYAPSVGRYHGLGAQNTTGLALRAVCDLNPGRLEQAGQDFADLKTHTTAETLADDPAVHLGILAHVERDHVETEGLYAPQEPPDREEPGVDALVGAQAVGDQLNVVFELVDDGGFIDIDSFVRDFPDVAEQLRTFMADVAAVEDLLIRAPKPGGSLHPSAEEDTD